MSFRSAMRRIRHAPGNPEQIRRNILESAEFYHSRGLDSRIPFLKRALAGQDIPKGSTAKREDGVAVPEWKEGQLVIEPRLDEALRFNIFNASSGLQAFYVRPFQNDDTPALIVTRSITSWNGDLRINVTGDPRLQMRYHAFYSGVLNHVILRPVCEKVPSAATHEMEHALHSNLALMIWGDASAIPIRRMEYLAMLAETIKWGEFPQLDIALRHWPQMLNKPGQMPHILSSLDFLIRLPFKYDISAAELATFQLELSRTGRISTAHGEFLQKVWHCAKAEYDRVYQSEFGISRAELAGIVAELPMI